MENNIRFFGDQIFFSYDLLHVYPVKKKKKNDEERKKKREEKKIIRDKISIRVL